MNLRKYCLILLICAPNICIALATITNEFIEQVKIAVAELDINPACKSAYLADIITYLDAGGKIPSGLTNINFFDLGNFDLCYGKKTIVDGGEIDRKYCLNTIPIAGMGGMFPTDADLHRSIQRFSPTPRMIGQDTNSIGIHLGMCVPATCAIADMQNITDALFNFIKGNSTNFPLGNPVYKEEWCYSKATDPELSTGAIATIIFLSIIAAIVVISSAYDYYLIQTEKKPAHGMLLAFSAISNGKKLLTVTTNPDQLLCINGIRAISMAWVLLGHDYANITAGPIMNFLDLQNVMTIKKDAWLASTPLSVDTFFAVGGLITMYTFLKARDKGISFNIPMYYVHRYLRLTPAVVAVLLIHYNLLKYMGNGPLWVNVDNSLMQECHENWYPTILYIQNYVKVGTTCVPQTWYLSVDFQLFFLSPLVLFPLTKWPKVGYGILAILVPLGFIIPTIVSYKYSIGTLLGGFGGPTEGDSNEAADDYMTKYYFQTHSRFGPYVIGMVFGAIIYKMRKEKLEPIKNKKNILIAMAAWILVTAALFGLLYDVVDLEVPVEYNRLAVAFYNGFNRNAWAVGVCIVVLLCVSGFGGFINDFLSCASLQFISKLSYSMYLTHYAFLILMYASSRVPVHFSHFTVMHKFWGDFVYSLGLAVILCLCFESPIIILEKYLLGSGSSKSQKNKDRNKLPA